MSQPHWPQSLFTSHRMSFQETSLCLKRPARKLRFTPTGCVIGISLISISSHARKRGSRPRKRGIRKAVMLRLQHPGNCAKKAKTPLALPRVHHLSWNMLTSLRLFFHSILGELVHPGGLRSDVIISWWPRWPIEICG